MDLLDPPRGIEPAREGRGVLPEDLIDHVVGIQVQGRDGEVAFEFAPAQDLRPEQYDVAGLTGRSPNSLYKVAAPDRTTITFTQS